MTVKNSTVDYEVKGHVAYITMNRPDKLNAINAQMRAELMTAFRDVSENSAVRLAVYTGAGRAFSTGHDLSESMEPGATPGRGSASLDHLYLYLSEIGKPIIGAINGTCLAQGAALALLTDIKIATPNASFGWPQAKLGLTSISGPSIASEYFPVNVAMNALFTGEPISAGDALRFGAVNEIVPQESLRDYVDELARAISSNAPLAISGMKQAVLLGRGMSLRQRIEIAGLISERASTSEDQAEGLRAYAEGRRPVFVGR